jgi:hypothetical protein
MKNEGRWFREVQWINNGLEMVHLPSHAIKNGSASREALDTYVQMQSALVSQDEFLARVHSNQIVDASIVLNRRWSSGAFTAGSGVDR